MNWEQMTKRLPYDAKYICALSMSCYLYLGGKGLSNLGYILQHGRVEATSQMLKGEVFDVLLCCAVYLVETLNALFRQRSTMYGWSLLEYLQHHLAFGLTLGYLCYVHPDSSAVETLQVSGNLILVLNLSEAYNAFCAMTKSNAFPMSKLCFMVLVLPLLIVAEIVELSSVLLQEGTPNSVKFVCLFMLILCVYYHVLYLLPWYLKRLYRKLQPLFIH